MNAGQTYLIQTDPVKVFIGHYLLKSNGKIKQTVLFKDTAMINRLRKVSGLRL